MYFSGYLRNAPILKPKKREALPASLLYLDTFDLLRIRGPVRLRLSP